MRRIEIRLEPEQHQALKEIATRENRSLSGLIREMLHKQLAEYKRKDLAWAAAALLADYRNDSDLTAFSPLDSEDFRP